MKNTIFFAAVAIGIFILFVLKISKKLPALREQKPWHSLLEMEISWLQEFCKGDSSIMSWKCQILNEKRSRYEELLPLSTFLLLSAILRNPVVISNPVKRKSGEFGIVFGLRMVLKLIDTIYFAMLKTSSRVKKSDFEKVAPLFNAILLYYSIGKRELIDIKTFEEVVSGRVSFTVNELTFHILQEYIALHRQSKSVTGVTEENWPKQLFQIYFPELKSLNFSTEALCMVAISQFFNLWSLREYFNSEAYRSNPALKMKAHTYYNDPKEQLKRLQSIVIVLKEKVETRRSQPQTSYTQLLEILYRELDTAVNDAEGSGVFQRAHEVYVLATTPKPQKLFRNPLSLN